MLWRLCRYVGSLVCNVCGGASLHGGTTSFWCVFTALLPMLLVAGIWGVSHVPWLATIYAELCIVRPKFKLAYDASLLNNT